MSTRLTLLLVTCSLLRAGDLAEDPVLKARTLRAQAQGISEADLPPVPRSVIEPPPLPPPELHRKDAPGFRGGKAVAKGKRATKVGKAAPGAVGKPVKKTAKHPVKATKKGHA